MVEPFSGITAAPKAVEITGGVATPSEADAVLPVPPFVDVTAAVVFVKLPEALPRMLTLNVQELFVLMEAPESVIEEPPAAAVMVPPPQAPVKPLGLATSNPTGSVSVSATPVIATGFVAGLVIVKLRVVTPLSETFEEPNAMATDGGPTTLMLADAVPPVPPSKEVTVPVVLFWVPAVVPVTFTEKVHEASGLSTAPVRTTLVSAAAAAMVPPPHVPLIPFGVEMASPDGSASAKAMLLRNTLGFGLVIVKVSVVVPFSATETAPNVLVMLGGATTVIVVPYVFPVPPSSELTVTELLFTPVGCP